MPHHIDKNSSSFFIEGKRGDDLIICTATDKRRFTKRDEKLMTSDGDLLIFEKKNFIYCKYYNYRAYSTIISYQLLYIKI